ncbi:MAG: DUF4345 family protein [Pseudomonadota bacterium]
MTLERIVIILTASFFLLYGLAFSLVPVNMALAITGSEPQGISALVDFQATYGGMTVAVGLTLFYLYSMGQGRACLVIVIIVLLSMAATRSLGLEMHGPGNFLMYLYLALELLGSALATIALRGISAEK